MIPGSPAAVVAQVARGLGHTGAATTGPRRSHTGAPMGIVAFIVAFRTSPTPRIRSGKPGTPHLRALPGGRGKPSPERGRGKDRLRGLVTRRGCLTGVSRIPSSRQENNRHMQLVTPPKEMRAGLSGGGNGCRPDAYYRSRARLQGGEGKITVRQRVLLSRARESRAPKKDPARIKRLSQATGSCRR